MIKQNTIHHGHVLSYCNVTQQSKYDTRMDIQCHIILYILNLCFELRCTFLNVQKVAGVHILLINSMQHLNYKMLCGLIWLFGSLVRVMIYLSINSQIYSLLAGRQWTKVNHGTSPHPCVYFVYFILFCIIVM